MRGLFLLGLLRVREVDSVSERHRSFLLASLVAAFLLVMALSFFALTIVRMGDKT